MRYWALVVSLACVLGTLPLAAAPQSPSPSWDRLTIYQFQGQRLPAPGVITDARIEFSVAGQRVYSRRFRFRLEIDQNLTVPVADPARAAALGAPGSSARDVRIDVYVGDVLLDSFDLASFRAYDANLKRTDRAELQPILRAWAAEAARGAAAEEEPRLAPRLSAEDVGHLSERVLLDPCVDLVPPGLSAVQPQLVNWL